MFSFTNRNSNPEASNAAADPPTTERREDGFAVVDHRLSFDNVPEGGNRAPEEETAAAATAGGERVSPTNANNVDPMALSTTPEEFSNFVEGLDVELPECESEVLVNPTVATEPVQRTTGSSRYRVSTVQDDDEDDDDEEEEEEEEEEAENEPSAAAVNQEASVTAPTVTAPATAPTTAPAAAANPTAPTPAVATNTNSTVAAPAAADRPRLLSPEVANALAGLSETVNRAYRQDVMLPRQQAPAAGSNEETANADGNDDEDNENDKSWWKRPSEIAFRLLLVSVFASIGAAAYKVASIFLDENSPQDPIGNGKASDSGPEVAPEHAPGYVGENLEVVKDEVTVDVTVELVEENAGPVETEVFTMEEEVSEVYSVETLNGTAVEEPASLPSTGDEIEEEYEVLETKVGELDQETKIELYEAVVDAVNVPKDIPEVFIPDAGAKAIKSTGTLGYAVGGATGLLYQNSRASINVASGIALLAFARFATRKIRRSFAPASDFEQFLYMADGWTYGLQRTGRVSRYVKRVKGMNIENYETLTNDDLREILKQGFNRKAPWNANKAALIMLVLSEYEAALSKFTKPQVAELLKRKVLTVTVRTTKKEMIHLALEEGL